MVGLLLCVVLVFWHKLYHKLWFAAFPSSCDDGVARMKIAWLTSLFALYYSNPRVAV